MIVVKLQGGLGNQLFQYATARALARHHRTSVAFDLSFFQALDANTAITPRSYELHNLGIVPRSVPLLSQIAYGLWRPPFQKKRIQQLAQRLHAGMIYREKSFRFDPTLRASTTDRTYLVGYFQSERYFEDSRTLLLEELKFPTSPPPELASLIQSTPSVSLHIRRGDYATNPITRQFHGMCSLDYYAKAVELLTEKLGPIHLFVFSDDLAWAREKLHFAHPVTFVEGHSGAHSYKDMQLMSLCHHHIIAYSSFSWWGAWLNPSPEKIVIAPRQWFAEPTAESQSQDLVPPSWIRV